MAQRHVLWCRENADILRELKTRLLFGHPGNTGERLSPLRLHEQAKDALCNAAGKAAHGQHANRSR
ncbi:hypothetical protein D3C81_2118290 [compost metagenome]